MGLSERNKGKRGERVVKDELMSLFPGTEARRTAQFNGREGQVGDVKWIDGVHVESKFVEKLNLQAAMEQAIRDAPTGCLPIVCHKRSRKDLLVTLRLLDLPGLVSLLKGYT